MIFVPIHIEKKNLSKAWSKSSESLSQRNSHVLGDHVRELGTVFGGEGDCTLFQVERRRGQICVLKRSCWLWRGKRTGWSWVRNAETEEEAVDIKWRREGQADLGQRT